MFLTAFVVFFLRLPLADPIARADPPPPPSELVGERTASSRTFDNHDRTYTTRLYSGPVHFRDTEGQWRPISSALVPSAESGYGFENEANRFRTFFKPTLASDYLALDASGGRWRVMLQNAAQVSAQTAARKITYPGVFLGADLRYDLRPDALKETLLLRSAQAPTSYRFLLTPPASARVHVARRRRLLGFLHGAARQAGVRDRCTLGDRERRARPQTPQRLACRDPHRRCLRARPQR